MTDYRDVDLDLADDDPRLSRPGTDRRRLDLAALAQFRFHQDEETIPTNGRFIFYELEQQGVVSKENPLKDPSGPSDGPRRKKEDRQYLSEAMTRLRERGIIPWAWVVDERRNYTSWLTAPTVGGYVIDALNRARIDRWAGRPAPLILSESGDVAGVLDDLAYRYAVPITATSGQARAHLINEVAPNLRPKQRVLYLGDADLSGGKIEDNTASVLIEHAPGWAYSVGGLLVPTRPGARVLVPPLWERLALTEEQVDADERLLGLAIIKTDNRFSVPYTHRAVELETLGQRVIMTMVKARLDELVPEPIEVIEAREEEHRAEVRELLRRAGLIGGEVS